MNLTKAEKTIFDMAYKIAEKIREKAPFTLPNTEYEKEDQEEIIQILLRINEISNVIAEEDGLHVFLY